METKVIAARVLHFLKATLLASLLVAGQISLFAGVAYLCFFQEVNVPQGPTAFLAVIVLNLVPAVLLAIIASALSQFTSGVGTLTVCSGAAAVQGILAWQILSVPGSGHIWWAELFICLSSIAALFEIAFVLSRLKSGRRV